MKAKLNLKPREETLAAAKAKLNLKPHREVLAAQKKVNSVRLLALSLICLFSFMAGISLLYGFWMSLELEGEQKSLNLSVEMLKKQHGLLSEELAEMKRDLKLYKEAVAFVKEELPALECLLAVETALLDEMWLSRLEIDSDRVALQGYAMTEDELLEFAREISASPVISNVDLPVMRRVKKRGKMDMVEFSLNCSLKRIANPRGGMDSALLKK